MKKCKLSVMCIALAGLTLTTSCIGSFALTNKVKAWNERATSSKLLNELIFIGLHIVPVYEVTILADILVINSIEFWSGDNPVAAGQTTEIENENGKFIVTTTEDGYLIEKEGEEIPMELKFEKGTQSWNVITNNESYEIMHFNNNGTITMNLQDGRRLDVTPDEQGIITLRDAVMGETFIASR